MYRLIATTIALSSCLTVSADQQTQQPLINNEAKPARALVSSKSLEADIKVKNLLARAHDLYKIAELSIDEHGHPTRVIGSEGHLGTLEYIYSTLGELGDYYTVTNQTFHATIGRVYEKHLVVGDRVQNYAYPFALTPPTKGNDAVFGNLTLAKNFGCDASDYPSATKGNVVVVKRGDCSFGDKSKLAGRAGAITAIITDKDDFSGTLGTPDKDHVATFSLRVSHIQKDIDSVKAGDVVGVSSYIDGFVVNTPTTNIIAQTNGGDQDNCVMLGGHSDSVDAGPGINDDGSGTLTLLEVATQLVKYDLKNCVRFAWWSAEEEGLIGSDYYVNQLSKEENQKIRLFMDYDMLASPNFAYQVYDGDDKVNPAGSTAVRQLYTDWYADNGLNFTYIRFDGRSDYDAFIRHGIPGGGIATGAEGVKTPKEQEMYGGKAGDWYDPCYHQLCDDISNLALGAWEINSKLVAHSVATYALSLDDFPKRKQINSQSLAVEESSYAPEYHGPQLFI